MGEAARPCLAWQRELAGVPPPPPPPAVITPGAESHTLPATPLPNLLADLFLPSRPVEHPTLPQGPREPGQREGSWRSVPKMPLLLLTGVWSGLRDSHPQTHPHVSPRLGS